MIYSSFQRSDCKYAKSWTARFPILDCTFWLDCTLKLYYGCGVGGQMPAAAAAAMLGKYSPVLTYTPASGHPSAIMSAAGTILLAAAPPGSASPACTVLLVSNLNEEVVSPNYYMLNILIFQQQEVQLSQRVPYKEKNCP